MPGEEFLLLQPVAAGRSRGRRRRLRPGNVREGNRPKSLSPNFSFKLYQTDMFRGSSCTQTTGVSSAKGSRMAFNCDCGSG